MYVLLEGEIDILLADLVFETAGTGALLGEMALIDDTPRTANAVAKTPPGWPKSIGAGFIFSLSSRRTLRRM